MQTKGKKVLLLGDSITEGWGASEIERSYASVLMKLGEFGEMGNYGVAGTRIAAQKKEPNENFGTETFHMRAERMEEGADILLVFGGTNDYGHGDAPIGRLGDDAKDTFYGAYTLLLQYLLKKYETAKIFAITPIHREKEEEYYNGTGLRNCGTLSDYARAEREVCEKLSVPVLDLYACEAFPAMTVDGLHPNDEGHALLAELIIKYIRAL